MIGVIMPLWKPGPIWEGLDAFIIGGGTSLRGFDWTLLHDEKTIGCNQAFRLGERVCDICVFGDHKFLFGTNGDFRQQNYEPMSQFKNPIVTSDPKCKNSKVPWLLFMPRLSTGLAKKDALAWNCNTGAMAINLALILGAKVVYLLGFDMRLDDKGKPNWHSEPLIDRPRADVYPRMINNLTHIRSALPKVFPGRSIFNINANSRLTIWPTLDPDTFWSERKKHGTDRPNEEAECVGQQS